MSKKNRNILAAVVISILTIRYFIFYFTLLWKEFSGAVRILFIVIPLLISTAMIRTCVERIREISSGYMDDLNKY